MVRSKDLPEDIEEQRQRSRRSLFPTPPLSLASDARSTPFPTAEENENIDANEIPMRKGLELKPRRLQRSETSETTAVGCTPFFCSLTDVTIRYIDPPPPPSLEKKLEEQKPLSNCTKMPNIRHEWTEL